jgi:phosphoribosylanthranilate isomerase
MRRVRVKICGITREKDLVVATAAGADAVGFIVNVPSSPRNLTLKRAERLAKQVPVFVDSVVVTVFESVDSLIKIHNRLKTTIIQIHGEKPSDPLVVRKKISNARLVKAIHLKTEILTKEVKDYLGYFDAVLLDSFVQGQHGGTGLVQDWELSRQFKHIIKPMLLILAGGLNPDNVKGVINKVQPYAVDVCTGVESKPGIKDSSKIHAFINKAKEVKIYDS